MAAWQRLDQLVCSSSRNRLWPRTTIVAYYLFNFSRKGAAKGKTLREQAAELLQVRLWGIADPKASPGRTPTFAIRVGGQHPQETSTELARRGIFTWDGHYYAIEVFDRLGLLDTGGAVRIGFCHYHTADEVDRVLETLAELAA